MAADWRRVIEALRSGVPNREAARAMGCNQDAVEQLFHPKLEQASEQLAAGEQVTGLLISGGFGSGKSHLLEYLEDRALAARFVCSHVVIGKETPLYDADKLLRAAVESAVVPGQTGQTLQEVAHGLRRLRDTDAYARFRQWCNSARSGVSALFPASLFLHERLENDPETVEAIVNFWSGEPLGSGDRLSLKKLKDALQRVEGAPLFQLNAVPVPQLSFERFRFIAQMIAGAGYRGWLISLDEIELIGRYSFLQRANSYAELARWMGLLPDDPYPGILTIASISDDFVPAILERIGGKGDFGSLRAKLESNSMEESRIVFGSLQVRVESRQTEESRILAARAAAGMQLIRRDAIDLRPLNKETVERAYHNVKELHARAYGWQPPEIARPEPSSLTRMRKLVRRWINEWDVVRLYNGVPVTFEEREVATSYAEDTELEAAPAESEEPRPGTIGSVADTDAAPKLAESSTISNLTPTAGSRRRGTQSSIVVELKPPSVFPNRKNGAIPRGSMERRTKTRPAGGAGEI